MSGSANYPNYNLGATQNEFAGEMQKIAAYLFNNVDTVQPVEVVSVVEGGNLLVNVKPVLQQTTTTGKPIEITEADIIHNVPLMMMKGNGCEITFTVQAGDKGLLIASKFDISRYKLAHATAPLDSLKMFRFASSFFLPLDFVNHGNTIIIKNQQSQIEVTPQNIIVTGQSKVTVNSPHVELGGSGGKAVARVGDSVQVNVTSGSSAGTWSGTITAGSGVTTSI